MRIPQPSIRIGIGLSIFSAIITLLYDIGKLPGAVQCVEFLVALAGFFVAGMLSARQTGRVTSGLLGGIIASVLPAVVILGANILLAIIAPSAFATAFGYHDVSTGALVLAAIISSVVGLILWLAFGAGLGALGGLIGRGQALKQAAETPSVTRN